ncbi:hypothetical protein B9Z19DRAFT_1108094 [Tuber borchii]|uniref:Uncharacterized protein n=1 Tax=Tuber borchii TaxID=42251 RepID=A0A2T6ZTJ5_TUBBO|nr:hypothetical protein B9Z19DRAFT_1108094 [Tuber borchii]
MTMNIYRSLLRPHAKCVEYVYLHRQYTWYMRQHRQFIKYTPPRTYQRLLYTDSSEGLKPMPASNSEAKGNLSMKTLWDCLGSNDKYRDSEIPRYKAMADITTTMETLFALVDTKFSQLRRDLQGFADERNIQSNQLRVNMVFIQWQLGILSAMVVAIFGLAVYSVKLLMQHSVPRLPPTIPPPTITENGRKVLDTEGEGGTPGIKPCSGEEAGAKGEACSEGGDKPWWHWLI